MVEAEVEGASPRSRRPLIVAAIAAGSLVLLFVAAVAILNATIFSASGFVSSYLSALARHDVASVMTMPGVTPVDEASNALIDRDALGELDDIALVDDTDVGDGVHRVTYEYRVGDGPSARTTFVVELVGSRLGVFSSWRFVNSPVGVLEITPHNALEFEVNGVAVIAESGADVANPFQVLVPGAYTISHESEYLVAEPEAVLVNTANTPTAFTLEVQASDEFVSAVDEELQIYLDECARQEVLQPTGCPFGQSITDRIEGAPEWSMVEYPQVELVPGEVSGSWIVPPVGGTAHLNVDVVSLFDGSVETLDVDIPFTVSYMITLLSDGGLTITPL